jgi:hypothetical protein
VNAAGVEELILGNRKLTMRHLSAEVELSGRIARIFRDELGTEIFMHAAYKYV